MADWKNLLKDVLLADGKIDAAETKLIEKAVMEDGVVDRDEMDFLVDLRNSASKKLPKFEDFFFEALKAHILEDDKIDAKEVTRIHEIIMADGKVDKREKKFLKEVKAEAKKCSTKFDKTFSEYL